LAAEDVATPAPIASVEVRRENVFSPEEVRKAPFPFAFLNLFHATTREGFIRRELLVKPGDPLDPEKLKEAERSLRNQRLFRSVSVRSDGDRVTVETKDAWTFLPRFGFSNKGGKTTYQFGVEERSLFGTGRALEFKYDRDVERLSKSLFFSDPQTLGPHTLFQISASDLSDGRNLELAAGRPFYAVDTEQAAAAAYRHATFDRTLYAGGEEDQILKVRERRFQLDGGLRLDDSPGRVVRAHAAVEYSSTELRPGGLGAAPGEESRRFLYLSVGLSREGQVWIKRRRVERMDRDEDFNLAPTGRVDLALSPRVFGGQAAGRLRLSGSVGQERQSGLLLASGTAESRWQSGLDATLVTAELRAYVQRPGATIVARAATVLGWRLDPETRVELDGLTGVRGYRLHAASGTGRFVGNVEARFYLVPEVLRIFSLGAAAFVDDGIVSGPPDGFVHLTDAGVGLRIGLTRASKRDVLRIDVARAFRADPLGRTGWLLSFSSGQAF